MQMDDRSSHVRDDDDRQREGVRPRRLVLATLAVATLAMAAPACGDDEDDAPPVGSEVVPGEEGPVE